MSEADRLHTDQVEYWNGPGGARWIERVAYTDRLFTELTRQLLARAAPAPDETVIDVGCGCGATSAELVKRVGAAGHVIALDVSGPILAEARAVLAPFANAETVLADAATHPFAAGAADLVFSRFGVMFFGDPVAAFANLRQALKPAGRLVFACWREPSLNPWMMTPLQAAYQHVPRMPRPGPEEPGPFSFGNPERVQRILAGAGFATPTLEPIDLTFDIGVGEGLDTAVRRALTMGPTALALEGHPPEVRAKVAAEVKLALTPHVDGAAVKLPAAIWIVRAGRGPG
jgi:SAM-dependent methyltransferase